MDRKGNKYFFIKSFTLVELLIVIAILAVLAAAVVIVLNPAELLAQARDSQRITDLKTLKDAIDIFVVDNPSASLGTSQKVYVSLPDTSTTCANISLPTLPAGWTYNCVTTENLRNTDGTGWVPLNLGSIFGGTPIPYLPLDPGNDAVAGHYYTYTMGGSYELTALMEAEKSFAMKDGGAFVELYEIGSDISLLPVSRDPSLVGYWKMDEGVGITTGDLSGNGNIGDITGPLWVAGKMGNALSFDGVDDYVHVGSDQSIQVFGTDKWTISWWANTVGTGDSTQDFFNGLSHRPRIYTSISSRNIGMAGRVGGVYMSIMSSGSAMYSFGEWTHFAISADGSSYRIFVNGAEMKTVSYVQMDPAFYEFSMGKPDWSSESFKGAMDEVRIYDRALSRTELMSMYEADK
jgi:prepilin-type N-terminal cleavage/methylation domain-containing protein